MTCIDDGPPEDTAKQISPSRENKKRISQASRQLKYLYFFFRFCKQPQSHTSLTFYTKKTEAAHQVGVAVLFKADKSPFIIQALARKGFILANSRDTTD